MSLFSEERTLSVAGVCQFPMGHFVVTLTRNGNGGSGGIHTSGGGGHFLFITLGHAGTSSAGTLQTLRR